MDILESIAANLSAARAEASTAPVTETVKDVAPTPAAEPVVAPVIEKAPDPKEVIIKDETILDTPPPSISDDDRAYLDSLKDESNSFVSKPSDLVADKKTDIPEGQQQSQVKFNIDDEKINPYVAKAKEYESLLQDPFFKAFTEFRKGGGEDIRSFAKNIAGRDVDSLSPEDVYREDIKLLGITEEQIADEMDRFDLLSPVEKLRLTNPIKQALKKQQEESVKSFSMPVNKNAERQALAAQTAVPELNDTIVNMVGKKYSALTITPEMGEEIKGYVMSHTEQKFDNEGNFTGYDIKESIDTAVFKLYKKKLLKATAEAAAANAIDEAYRSRQRPSRVDEPGGGTPAPARSISDAVRGVTNNKWGN